MPLCKNECRCGCRRHLVLSRGRRLLCKNECRCGSCHHLVLSRGPRRKKIRKMFIDVSDVVALRAVWFRNVAFTVLQCCCLVRLQASHVHACISASWSFFIFLVFAGIAVGVVEVAVNIEADRVEYKIKKKSSRIKNIGNSVMMVFK